jgi:dipeptidyl aminopeptidase/acylaminoacyl peptidase
MQPGSAGVLARTGILALLVPAGLLLTQHAPAQTAPRLVIALSSFRDRPLHPRTYFYEHDGTGTCRQMGEIEAVNLRVETHPSLARGGALCAVASEVENNHSDTRLWDIPGKREVTDLPGLNTDAPEIEPSLSADAQWLVFSAWNRPGAPAGWSLFLYHLKERKLAELPVNTDDDEQTPSISGDGRLIAFVSNRPGGAGLSDLWLYDRTGAKLVPLPGLNTARRELDPALSADGRYLAFTSDRPGGAGTRDIYLYDRQQAALVPLPGLNGPGIDQTPALSPDGRYLAFVAERVSGQGERDVYLYDRQAGKLLPAPGLNTKAEDFDPSVTYRE